MKKIVLIGLFCCVLNVIFSAGARDYKDNAVLLGYSYSNIYEVADIQLINGSYTKATTVLNSHAFQFQGRSMFSKDSIGFFSECSFYKPFASKITIQDQTTNVDMTSVASKYCMEASLGGYGFLYNNNSIKIPLGIGIHCNLLSLSTSGITSSTISGGISTFLNFEYSLNRNIGLFVGIKGAYDFYGMTTTSTSYTSQSESGRINDFFIAPTVGLKLSFGEQ